MSRSMGTLSGSWSAEQCARNLRYQWEDTPPITSRLQLDEAVRLALEPEERDESEIADVVTRLSDLIETGDK